VNTLAPPKRIVFVMIAFALSCVGLLLFLWLSFGGSLPLAPQGYRFTVEFGQAVQLGTEADVDIAGVPIGKVVSVGLDRHSGLTRAVIQIDSRYAPRPKDTRAILREKTLLGETYVELSMGNPKDGMLADGGRLPNAQVAPTVQLGQILSTFDPTTRKAFETWLEQDGMAFTDRGADLNAALAELYPFASNVNAVLAVLNRDSAATRTLLSDGGQVLSAVARVPAQLQGLVRNADTVFATTASADTELAAAIRALPGFLTGTRETIAQLDSFAANATPLVQQLRPAVQQLTPALQETVTFAPELRQLLTEIGPLNKAAAAGEPALERFLKQSEPLLAKLGPYLGSVVPIVDYIGKYKREIAAFFANSAATTEGTEQSLSSSKLLHYVRLSSPVNPESLAAYPNRPSSNRSNAYMQPGGYNALTSGLEVFGSYLCTPNPLPSIGPTIPSSLQTILSSVYFGSGGAGPACKPQAPLGETLAGLAGLSSLTAQFPTLKPLP
jgi:phospholipid/cholesterol/gamma-HCH transport system substrate-binding protein